MNTDNGRFVPPTDTRWETLAVGEIVKIKGVEFVVDQIERGTDRCVLRMLPEVESMNRHERRRLDALARLAKP